MTTTINSTTLLIGKLQLALKCVENDSGVGCAMHRKAITQAAEKYLQIIQTRTGSESEIQYYYNASMLCGVLEDAGPSLPVFIHLGFDFPIKAALIRDDDYESTVVLIPDYGAK